MPNGLMMRATGHVVDVGAGWYHGVITCDDGTCIETKDSRTAAGAVQDMQTYARLVGLFLTLSGDHTRLRSAKGPVNTGHLTAAEAFAERRETIEAADKAVEERREARAASKKDRDDKFDSWLINARNREEATEKRLATKGRPQKPVINRMPKGGAA